jgi:hypothetical protein
MATMTFDVQLSDWARYVAQDADGAWYEYEDKPEKYPVGWHAPKLGFLCRTVPPADWRKEVYEVIRE